ncbi:MAG: class II aldolase/adducin family protein [Candidatus Omnitrophica bacterium]|jgi:L-fuculose-phosphate aldolase|nr:class II aldolase/adducin family protein [Candidatus Omnitrophota bacterium]MDD3987357.1 class II aldolase/adducin family protein [Candidatus Omnitrophota bacterium]MDD4981598.1 class II aldolase/adducin family protein [Candidatus Omnitrophota bacterium]MDD5664984.1 class II aldolase/adducin family protein [Candidatus Omnitrophota bacterium]
MNFGKELKLRKEIIRVGSRLYQARLAVAKSGNISARLDDENILITATGTSLGELRHKDIVRVNLNTGKVYSSIKPSSELPLHSLVYKNFKANVVIHAHPPLTNGYFAVTSDLKALTFETKFYLGTIPVIEQDTPTVVSPQPVIAALKTNNLVVLKNHGAVALADKFCDAMSLIEALEEAVRTTAIARIFKSDILDDLDKALKSDLSLNLSLPMFSREHIQAIVDLVNKDELIARKGEELNLTVKLAIKLDGSDKVYKFNFEKGKIVRLDLDADAPFVISAPREVWEQVFLGKLDSFVAVTQGRMKLSGQLGQLSKWYVPFTRLFALFKEVKIR